MDSVFTQLQREIQKMSKSKKNVSRQDNYSQSFFNASPVMPVNMTLERLDQNNSTSRNDQLVFSNSIINSSQSISFSSPQTFRGLNQGRDKSRNKEVNQVSQPYQQLNDSISQRSESSSQYQRSNRNITPQQYNSRKEDIKDVFISKDELFKRVNHKFKKLISNRNQYLQMFKQSQKSVNSYWISKQQELQELIDEIQDSQEQYQLMISQHRKQLSEQQSQSNLIKTQNMSKSQERKIWLSKNPKIGKKASMAGGLFPVREESKSILQSIHSSSQSHEDQNESDCNVDDEEVQIKQAQSKQVVAQYEKDLKFQELSIEIATQNYNQINNYLNMMIQMCTQIQQMCVVYTQEKKADDEILFDELQSLHKTVQYLEERYFGTTIAWEKELRDLISKSKQKSQKIVDLEKTITDLNLKKGEIQFKYESMEREIELINKSLYIQYGISFSNYNSIDHTTKLDLENIKKVFEENERLKTDFDKLLDNIESSRGDLSRIHNSNRAAVQGIPTLLNQQYKIAKETFEQQIQQTSTQFDQKLQVLNNELSKSRHRVIEMIDEKQVLEKEIYQLKFEKKDIKNDSENKTKKIQELELQLQDTKYKSNHIVLQAESKSMAVNEVHTRNEILHDSLDKFKTELLNQKRLYSQLESEHFDIEKENLRLKKDNKRLQLSNECFQDEKEHLIQMLEMKNHLLATDTSPSILGSTRSTNNVTQLDQFLAIQRLSMFVLNRSGNDSLDDNTKNIVKGIFNENVCKLLDQYETKIIQQKKAIQELHLELNESQQLTINLLDQNQQYIELLLDVTQQFQKLQLNEIPQEILLLNEKLLNLNPQFLNDKYNLKKQQEEQSQKLKDLYNRMEQFKEDQKETQINSQVKNNHTELQLTERNLLIAQQSPYKLRDQLFNEFQGKTQARLDDLKLQNENLQYKLDQTLSENDEINRQLMNLKKKENDFGKLKSQNEQLRELVSKLQKQNQNQMQYQDMQNEKLIMDKEQSTYSDLKLVIQKLDSELKREKSQVEFLRQQLGDQSLLEGLDGFIDGEDLFFNKSGEARITNRGGMTNYGNDHSVGRINKNSKNKSSDILTNVFDDSSPIHSPFQKNHSKNLRKSNIKQVKQQYELQMNQFKKNIEDNKQMIELQCIVIEDLLEQRNKLQKDLNSLQQSRSTSQSPETTSKFLRINNGNEKREASQSNERVSSINRGESKIPRLSISKKQGSVQKV
eukprot:403376985